MTMPIYGKNLKKSSPEPIDQWPWNFVCSIVYASTTKIIQIITLGWPWLILFLSLSHGLGPYFQRATVNDILHSSAYFTIHFDETFRSVQKTDGCFNQILVWNISLYSSPLFEFIVLWTCLCWAHFKGSCGLFQRSCWCRILLHSCYTQCFQGW